MKHKSYVFLLSLFYILGFPGSSPLAQPSQEAAPPAVSNELRLVQAVMCEAVTGITPQNPAIVFSVSIGEVSCFTLFDPVPQRTYIFHKWFHRDKLSTKRKLFLKTPRWGTVSAIRLREADIGPWRVEITDEADNLLKVLRFSITE